MIKGECKDGNTIFYQFGSQVVAKGSGQGEFSNLYFRDDFPNAGDADPYLSCWQQGSYPAREFCLVLKSPQQNMRVNENLHHQNRSSISFGKGSLKSSGTTNAPLADPSLNRGRSVGIGTSFATGFPALAMTTSSPMATRSNSRERWGLASWML